MSRVTSLVCAISAALLILIITQNPSVEGYNVRFRAPYGPYSPFKPIQPLPCSGTNKAHGGSPGVCMFSFDCMQRRGTPIGTCVDSIYVGSCCRLVHNPPVTVVTSPTTTSTGTSNPLLWSQGSPAPARAPGALVVSDAASSPRPRPVATSAAPSTATASSATATSSHETTSSSSFTESVTVPVDNSNWSAPTTEPDLSTTLPATLTTLGDEALTLEDTESSLNAEGPMAWEIFGDYEPTTQDSYVVDTTTRLSVVDEKRFALANKTRISSTSVPISVTTDASYELKDTAADYAMTTTKVNNASISTTTENSATLNTLKLQPSNSTETSNPTIVIITLPSTAAIKSSTESPKTEATRPPGTESILENVVIQYSTESSVPTISSLSSVTMVAETATTTTARPATTTQYPSTKIFSATVTETPSATTASRPSIFKNRECGVRPLRPVARVVGGRNAHFGEWPWQVLIKEATWLGLFVKTKCGGVLIDHKWVVTAAHCQPGFLGSLVVIVGEYDLTGDFENLKPVAKPVKRMIVHRDYNPNTFENDIALLELDTGFDVQPHVIPICLPDDKDTYVGSVAHVAGWGKLNYGGPVPSILQVVRLPILPNGQCQTMFLSAGHVKAIRDTFVCAGYTDGGKDSCEGDSGGPLMVLKNGRWQLVGTVSHGIKCAEPNLPGVYMRTSAYRPWIDSIIGKTL